MAPQPTFTALPSSSMVTAAAEAYDEIINEAEARGMVDVGKRMAMSAALTAAQVSAPSVSHEQVRDLASIVTAAADPRVALIDTLRSFGIQIHHARETVDA